MPYKYDNITSFPSSSFDFPTLLHHQGLDSLIADSGSIYPDLVKDFYENLSITPGCILSSKVKGKDIVPSMEDFRRCLDIPYDCQRILYGYIIEWADYNQVNYYFSISRLTEQEIMNKRAYNPSSDQFILSAKNLSISDRILQYFLAYILLPKHSNHSQLVILRCILFM